MNLDGRGTNDLTERELQILAFEKTRWRHTGARETAIRDLFGLSGTQYAQIVNDLIDREEAYVHDPPLVKRLRRLRDHQRAVREGRAAG
jgi:hypothetical protein